MVCLFVKNDKKGKIYGNATLWCWIDGPWAPLRIYSYYAPIWITILAALCIYVRVGIEIFRARNQLKEISHRTDPSLHTDAGGKSPLPLQGSITNASEATNKDYESEHEQPIFTGTRTTEIEVTHGSWENGTALSTNPTPRYPRASDVNHLSTPVKEPDSNYRVTISAVPNTHTSNGRGGARRNASSLDKIKWAYTKVAMLFCISILITWVPASWNTVIYFTTSLGICRSVWADLRGPSKQHRKTEGFRMMDRPMTGIHRGATKETESMVELSTSRSQTNRSLRSAEVDSI
ncbi:putative g-protein coupled receptor protein [Botrytis cinerea BcDW1]|uniref:Putative g-protein coupled receptor protein n=1 Tax=Botryotinia fuckeliana (strain BcDW1) TaxID=1290391 RepID=M7UUU9_BOTF1|nr:putative g-protein coupled receptor protein [Botrytis cinerea BcDW1]